VTQDATGSGSAREDVPQPALSDDELLAAFKAITRDYGGRWYAFRGVIPGLLYARRPNSSPPAVVRSATIGGLREEIERAEAQRSRRP